MAQNKKRVKRKNSKQFKKKFKKRFFSRSSLMVIFLVFLIIGMIGIGYHNLEERAKVREQKIEKLQSEIDTLEKDTDTLEEERTNMDTPSFKEEIARRILGMINKDEYSIQQSQSDGSSENTDEGKADLDEKGDTETEEDASDSGEE